MIAICTPRLILRSWQESDKITFAHMNGDSDVMQYFPKTLNTQESNDLANKIQNSIEQNGYGFWATEYRNTGEFIGFIGLHSPIAPLPFSPCIEIGWRLDKRFWGEGLATEGAKVALDFGFNHLNLDEIVSFTAHINQPSQRVMQKIGMKFDSYFSHPNVPIESILNNHVLYRITCEQFLTSNQ